MGSDCCSENVTLAIGLVERGGLGRREERKEVELPRGCSKGKRPGNMGPPPGAGREDVKIRMHFW